MRQLHLLLFALLLSPGVALGQEAPQPAPPPAPPIPRAEPPPPEEQMPGMETLISGKSSQGGYGGPVLMYSRVMGKDALFFGGQGGWIANHQLVIGAAGYAMVTRIAAPADVVDTPEDLRFEFGYGGLWLEYVFFPDKLVHASLGTLLGGGVVDYGRVRRVSGEDRTVESDVVLVAAPALAVELNITRAFQLSLGAGYRYVGSVNLPGVRQQDVSGFTGSLMLRFGRF